MDLQLIRIFIKVAQNGSFSRAAEQLKLPKSTVSKAVAELEAQTKTKLILRTTRSLTLTDSGRALLASALTPLNQLEDAFKALYGKDSVMAGPVRLTAPEDLGAYIVAPAIAELARLYPQVNFELNYTNTVVDLVKDGFDLAVRLGKNSDSALKIKRVGEVTLVTAASPKYLKGKPKITLPSDLKDHQCLALIYKDVTERWSLRSTKGQTATVEIRPSVSSNQMTSLLKMALVGGGVGLLPSYMCAPYFESGELVRVLPEWKTPGIPTSIVSPLAPSSTARLKVTVDHLAKVLEGLIGKN